jgi:hypothetical protein
LLWRHLVRGKITGGAYVPTVVVGMYAPFGVAGVYHATICVPWAFIVGLWHVERPTMGAYIATSAVTTYAPPAQIYANNAENLGQELSRDVSRQPH